MLAVRLNQPISEILAAPPAVLRAMTAIVKEDQEQAMRSRRG